MNISKRIAFGGIITALGFAIAYLGNLFSVMKFLAPVIAGFLLILNREIIDLKSAFITYITSTILLLLLAPSKISGLSYLVVFGYYPMIQPMLNRIKPVFFRLLLKSAIFNLIGFLSFYVGMKFFNLNILIEKYHNYLLLGVLLYNIFFAIYEFFVQLANKKITKIDLSRIRKAMR